MATAKLPDVRFVNQCVIYDSDAGSFTWRERPIEHFVSPRGWWQWNGRYAGKPAGRAQLCDKALYWTLTLNYQEYRAHRIAWLLTYGVDPGPLEIDHIDRNGLNNRISNLRLATRSQQAWNTRGHLNTRSGVKGVRPNGKTGFSAYITANGKSHYLGYFRTLEEAAEARRKAAIAFHREYARHE